MEIAKKNTGTKTAWKAMIGFIISAVIMYIAICVIPYRHYPVSTLTVSSMGIIFILAFIVTISKGDSNPPIIIVAFWKEFIAQNFGAVIGFVGWDIGINRMMYAGIAIVVIGLLYVLFKKKPANYPLVE